MCGWWLLASCTKDMGLQPDPVYIEPKPTIIINRLLVILCMPQHREINKSYVVQMCKIDDCNTSYKWYNNYIITFK